MCAEFHALFVAAGILIDFYFFRVRNVCNEYLAAAAGMQYDGTAVVHDVQRATGSDIDFGFLACFCRLCPRHANPDSQTDCDQQQCMAILERFLDPIRHHRFKHGRFRPSSSVQGNERAVAIWYSISFCSYASCSSSCAVASSGSRSAACCASEIYAFTLRKLFSYALRVSGASCESWLI